jgi:hypothetical protein
VMLRPMGLISSTYAHVESSTGTLDSRRHLPQLEEAVGTATHWICHTIR